MHVEVSLMVMVFRTVQVRMKVIIESVATAFRCFVVSSLVIGGGMGLAAFAYGCFLFVL